MYSQSVVTMMLAVASIAPCVYVSPLGNDRATGDREHPKKTLSAALKVVSGVPNSIIRLSGGTFPVNQTLPIGKNFPSLTIEGTGSQPSILTGGIEVRGWRKQGAFFTASVPDSIAMDGARMLMIGGQLRPRSRMPEVGEYLHQSIFDVPWMSTSAGGWKRKPTDDELTTMKCRPEDIGPWLDPASAEVTVYHMWDESCVGIKSVDPASGSIRFSSPCGHPPGAFDVHKYVVWNTQAGLSHAGQWFLDRRLKRLIYWPMAGEQASSIHAYLPTVNTLLDLSGAQNVTLRNLEVQVSNVPLKAGGFGAGEYDGAITASASQGLKLEKVAVRAVAGTGIKLIDSKNAIVDHCQSFDSGAGGIRVEGENSVVTDCTIRRVGLQYPSAIGLWVGGKRAITTHNEITDTSYSALVGAGEGQLISSNYIARAMTKLHDGAGIYFGFAGKVTVENNLVEEIFDTGGYGASAYYLDEQAHDCVVRGNVANGIVRPSQNHMAKKNTIEGNLFLNRTDLRLDFARCEGYVLRQNVLDCGGSLTLRLPADGASAIDSNVFGTETGANRVTLNQYAEIGHSPLDRKANDLLRPRIQLTKRRVWSITDVTGKRRIWDMSSVGPRDLSAVDMPITRLDFPNAIIH